LLTPEFMAKLGRLGLIGRKILAGKLHGERHSRKRGHSLEFADHRPYAQGDDLRRIDWNIYGRLERLFLKLFLDEEDISVHILLDRSKSMDFGAVRKLDYARRVAAAIGYIGMTNMDRVTVNAFAGDIEEAVERLRGRQVCRLFRFLEKLRPSGATNLGTTMRNFLLRNPMPGICVIISDLLDPNGFEQPLKAVAARGMETFVIHVLAREEIEPLVTGDIRLVDSETGEKVEISAGRRAIESYERSLRGFCASARDFCAKRGIAYVPASTAVPFEQLVLQYLRSVGLVK
jgi:uncharacterized protein (DUF58 family)